MILQPVDKKQENVGLYPPEQARKKDERFMDNQNRTGTPGAEENELNKKQVFTDIHSSPESTPVLISDYDALPELDMHKKTILDEAYAEQKNDRETHMPKMPATKIYVAP